MSENDVIHIHALGKIVFLNMLDISVIVLNVSAIRVLGVSGHTFINQLSVVCPVMYSVRGGNLTSGLKSYSVHCIKMCDT